ncbi:endonuclease/exonuclease/phosphatase family protein [Pseudoalteromonas sp. PAB 2.2]|uniref:endonuclease/exonuclease/phosphatase family protein n=1 Tax=Pseudoalteromonas sp. PAB 2.2 TaxID=1841508 RepID=UPI0009501368|nr:endonuclease/exonuclease/phosphatase family protein [Pseudoalteromonas sp. PAB 2.2]
MPHTHTLKFASLNLLNYTAPPYSFYQQHERYNNTQWQQKQQFVRDFLFDSKADVVAFQEVFSAHALEIQCKEAGYDYFETVDSPSHDALYPQVLFNPIVAIASKYPFTFVEPLTPCPELLEYLNNQSDFKFNRTPIKCFLDFPEFGEVCCYVVHFKSQRVQSMAHILNIHNLEDPLLQLLHQTVGAMQSQISRSLEASIVYYDALKTQREKQCATLVMGDFNDVLTSPTLSFMTQGFHPTRCEPCIANNEPVVGLTDAYLFCAASENNTKPFSHYYHGKGNVLDYILVSAHFNPQCALSKVSKLEYESYDEHLNPHQAVEDITVSDHSSIAIKIHF